MIFVSLMVTIVGVLLITLGIDMLRHKRNEILAVVDIAVGIFDILNVFVMLLK